MKYKTVKLLTIVVLSTLFTSCAKNYYVNYQTESANTSKIVIKPTKPTARTYVTINDNLIISKKNVNSITINNVPNGDYTVHYTSENGWYKERLNEKMPIKIDDTKEVTKLVEVPPFSTGYWVYVTGMAVLPWVIILAL